MPSEARSCDQVLHLLDAHISGELPVETSLAVLSHLSACPSCASALDAGTRVRSALKHAVEQDAVPAALLEKLERAQPRKSWIRAPRWAVAAIVLLAFFVGYGIRDSLEPRSDTAPNSEQQIPEMAVNVHRFCSADAATESLGLEYDGLEDMVSEQMPSDYSVAKSHRCLYGGRMFAHLILKQGDSTVSFAVTEKQGDELPMSRGGQAFEAAGVPVYADAIENHQISAFETSRHLVFVVSDFPGNADREIASSIAKLYAPAMRSTMKQEVGNAH